MPVMQIKSFEVLKDFKPYRLILSEEAKDIDSIEVNPEERYAVVFGNEANGISEELKEQWKGEDVIIEIAPNVESLNLAIAAGIALNKLK